MTDRNEKLAQANFAWLQNNTYPGRGIVAGLDETGNYLVQIYWIMGRSKNSQNRVFKSDKTGRLYTEAANAAKMTDPSLVIYNAMREAHECYIVSNGNQTDTIAESKTPHNLSEALRGSMYEPDDPNFTQRITAVSIFAKGLASYTRMSILRRSLFGSNCDHLIYEYMLHRGFGHCITTYSGDGDPLPSFRGDPLIMPLKGNIKRILQNYWDALNEEYRVSLAVKFINQETGLSTIQILNKNTQST